MQKLTGLTSDEAKQRLKQFGPNELEENRFGHWFENIRKILFDPMGLMLLILSATYFALGHTSDAIVLLIAYIPIIGMDVLLELKSQSALRALRQTIQKNCHVIRDGNTKLVLVRHLVPGDLVVLDEGNSVPADGHVVEIANLTVDESSLTGESVPITKAVGDEILSGTTVLTGGGVFRVEKTGASSQIGSIGKILQEFSGSPSPLLVTIEKAVKVFFALAILIATVVFAWSLHRGESFDHALISSLTLAMAAIPEEFPLVFTIYLSLAAYRLSKKGILVKSITAVEGLGRTDVICTDKTGTLTEGRFQLEKLIPVTAQEEISALEATALILACEVAAVDAMEAAIFSWVAKTKGQSFIPEVHANWNLIYDYPFDPVQKYMCHVWRHSSSGEEILAMKGAIEGVLAHCLPDGRSLVQASAQKESEKGMRLLGFAFKRGHFTGDRAKDEQELNFSAILSFSDPVRPDVPQALKRCRDKGIVVKMLTGDHLLTAHSIADRIGLPHSHDQLFDGPLLDRLSDSARAEAFKNGRIFARLKPEQKVELVKSLKASGAVVAMTGDGINDGPALKLADVGISMGEKATDVARSSAQLVLLKSHFSGIIHAVLEGERVLQSLRESFGYLIAFHLPIIAIAILQAFLLEDPILLPIHIILLELVVHPVSAFAFDRGSSNEQFSRQKQLINRVQVASSLLRGFLLTIAVIAVFVLTSDSIEMRRGLALITLILGNIGLVLAEKKGPKLVARNMIVFVLLSLLSGILIFAPVAKDFFHTASPSFQAFVLSWGFGILLGWIRRPSSSQTTNALSM